MIEGTKSDWVFGCEGPAIDFPFPVVSPGKVKHNPDCSQHENWINVLFVGFVLFGEYDFVSVDEFGLVSGFEILLELDWLSDEGDVFVISLPVVPVVVKVTERSQKRCIFPQHFYTLNNIYNQSINSILSIL